MKTTNGGQIMDASEMLSIYSSFLGRAGGRAQVLVEDFQYYAKNPELLKDFAERMYKDYQDVHSKLFPKKEGV